MGEDGAENAFAPMATLDDYSASDMPPIPTTDMSQQAQIDDEWFDDQLRGYEPATGDDAAMTDTNDHMQPSSSHGFQSEYGSFPKENGHDTMPSQANSPMLSAEAKSRLLNQQLKFRNSYNVQSFASRAAEEFAEPNNGASWMEQQPSGEENEEDAIANHKKLQKTFKRKLDRGQVSLAEEIAFKKLDKLHKARERKAKDDAAIETRDEAQDLESGDAEDPQSLFVQEFTHRLREFTHDNNQSNNHNSISNFNDHGFDSLEDVDDGVSDEGMRRAFQGLGKSSTLNAAPHAKSKTKKSNGKNVSKEQGAGVSKRKRKEKPPTKKALAATRAINNVLNTSNLLNINIFRDAETNRGFEEQPTFTATRKADAMKELLSSLPQEHRKLAKLDEKQIMSALKHFTGRGTCKSDGNGQWRVNGMISVLSHYQMLGVSVMREREAQEEEPRGGILADQMGLGKTVMMIANLINGRKIAHGPTLIVAPPSLLIQWMNELDIHAEKKHLGEVIRHHAGSRLVTQDPVASLSHYNIILTTYNEVAKSYPKWDPPADLTTPEQRDAWWKQIWEEERGTLHRIKFHRVILDEAQAIKNHHSQTSISCRGLEATHRWAISGTPVQNSLSEFYPFFKFLRVPFTGSFTVFKRNFCSDSDPQGVERLGLYLRCFMIRRTHNDTLLGAKLLVLPKPVKRDLPCMFSDIEREIYTIVRTRFVLRINGFSRTGQLKKNYSHILTMLLRLRQLVGHPLLIQDTLRDLLEPEDFEKLKKVTNRPVPPHSTQAALLRHLRMMLSAPHRLIQLESPTTSPPHHSVMSTGDMSGNGAGAMPQEIDMMIDPMLLEYDRDNNNVAPATDAPDINQFTPVEDNAPDSVVKTGKAFGLKNNYSEYLDELIETSGFTEEDAPNICCSCDVKSSVNLVASCKHVYCRDCLQKLGEQAYLRGQDHAACIVCGEYYTTVRTYTAVSPPREVGDEGASSQGSTLEGEPVQKKQKLTPKQVIDTWVDAEGHMLPSAKTLAVKAQLMNWFQESPGCKVIIYCQFLTMIRILSKMCAIEGWGYTQFTGLMSIERRAAVIKNFEQSDIMNIMIASLRTGGTGLNLTCANKVIIVDLWWNSAVEDQAFCRTYRRGQNKETAMTRLLVANSVDTDIQKMQRRKDLEIDGVMTSESGKNFSTADLLSLFGQVGTDENGNSFILVDDRDQNRRPPRLAMDDVEGRPEGSYA